MFRRRDSAVLVFDQEADVCGGNFRWRESNEIQMRKKLLVEQSGGGPNDAQAAVEVIRAAEEFEMSLGAGEKLKAIDYIRLLELGEDSDGEQGIQITAHWEDACEAVAE